MLFGDTYLVVHQLQITIEGHKYNCNYKYINKSEMQFIIMFNLCSSNKDRYQKLKAILTLRRTPKSIKQTWNQKKPKR